MISGGRRFSAFLPILLIGLFLRLFFLIQVRTVLPDEAYYMRIARTIVQEGCYGGIDEGQAGYRAQPLIPAVFSWAYRIAPAAAQSVCAILSLAAGLAAIALVFFGAQKILPDTASRWAAFALAISPAMIQDSIFSGTHSFFNLFFL